ncbi:MAG: GntR family transcriptional regulator [Anaerolineae bacterium]
MPLYHQLCEILMGKLLAGEFKPHEAIPTERDLIEQYGVSRITVRRALEELEEKGFVKRIQGRGTFVQPPRVERTLARLSSFSEELRARGMVPETRLLTFQHQPAPPQIAHALQVQESTPVWHIERLRLANGEIIALNISYVRLPSFIELTEDEIQQEVSLWSLLERKGIHMSEADKTIEAIVAAPEHARLLKVRKSASLLRVEGVTYASDGTPIEYSLIIARSDRYKYFLHITR